MCLPFQDLFVTFEVISCVEMTLGGDVQLSIVNRLKWNIGTPSVLSKGNKITVDILWDVFFLFFFY